MKTRDRVRLHVEELEGRLVPSTLTSSTNWSGYALNTGAGAVSQVAGNWVVPAVSTNVSGYSSAWVGIDGVQAFRSVEQIGTDSDYVNGQAHYYAWYEMYPAPSITVSLPIHVGDTISASVNYTSPNQFALSIRDVTTGGSFSTTQTSSQAQRSSAEWIQEAPSSFSGILPLANFGTINFSGASATVSGTNGPADNSWSGTTLYQVNMVTRTGALKATTSALSDSGSPTSNFSVTWVSSGSGGKGGGHKSPSVPPPDFSQNTSLLSVAVAGLAARPQGTPLSAPQSSTVTVPPVGVGLPSLPALSAVPAPFAHFGPDIPNGGTQVIDQVNTPELLPVPDGPGVPMNPGAPPQTDGLPTPQAHPVPASLPGASLEMDRPADAGVADGFWLSSASLEGVQAVLGGGQEGRDITLMGLALTLALDRARAGTAPGTDRKPARRSRAVRAE